MSKDYLPYKDIRKKIEGIETETSTKYQPKSILKTIPQLDKNHLEQYFDRDYVIDDDIQLGNQTVIWSLGNGVSHIVINGETYYDQSGEVSFPYGTVVTWEAFAKKGYTMNDPYKGEFELVKETTLPALSATYGLYPVTLVFSQGVERIILNGVTYWSDEYPEGSVVRNIAYGSPIRWQAYPIEGYIMPWGDSDEFELVGPVTIEPKAIIEEFEIYYEINQGIEKLEAHVTNDVETFERDEYFTFTSNGHFTAGWNTNIEWKVYTKEGYLADSGLNEQDDDTITVGSKLWITNIVYSGESTFSPKGILKEYAIPVNVNQGVANVAVKIKCNIENYERDETINVYSTKTLTARWTSQVSWTATAATGFTFNNAQGTLAESDKFINITEATGANNNVIHEYPISPVTKVRTYILTINLNQGVKNINIKYLNETDGFERDESVDYTNPYDWGSGLTTGGVDTRTVEVTHFTKITWEAEAATGYTGNSPFKNEFVLTGNTTITPTATLTEYDWTVELNQGVDHIDIKFENNIQNYTRNESVTDTNSTPRTGNKIVKIHKVRHFTKISGSGVTYTGFHWTTQTHPKIAAFTPQETDVNTPTTITFLYDSLTGADTFSPVTTINTYTVNFKLGQGVAKAVVNLKNSVDNYTQDEDVVLTSDANITEPDPKIVTKVIQHYTAITWNSPEAAVGYTIVTSTGRFSDSLTTGATYTVTQAKLNEYDLQVNVNQGVQLVDLNVACTIANYVRDENINVTSTRVIKVNHYSTVKYGITSATGYHLGSGVYVDPTWEEYPAVSNANINTLAATRTSYDNINNVTRYALGDGVVIVDEAKTISPKALINYYLMTVDNDAGTASSITRNVCQVNNYESTQNITTTGNATFPVAGNDLKNAFQTKHFSQITWNTPVADTGFHVVNNSGTFSSSVTGHDDYRVTACELNEYTMTVNLGQGVDWVNVKIETPAYGLGKIPGGGLVYPGRNETIKVTASGTAIKVNHYSKVTWSDSTAKTGYTIVTGSGTHSESITGTSTLNIPAAKLNEYEVTVVLNQGVVSADVSFSCGIENYIRNEVISYTNPDPSHGTSVSFTVKANHFTKITYTGTAYEGYTLVANSLESLTGDYTFNITATLNEYNLVVNLGQGIDFANLSIVNTVDNYNRNEIIKVENSAGSKTGVNNAATIKVRYYSSVTWEATAMTGWTITQASGTHSTKIVGATTLNIPVATLNKYNITIEMGGDRYTEGTDEAYVPNVGVDAVHVKEANNITNYVTNKTTDVTTNGTVVIAYFDSTITLTAEPKTGYTITTLPDVWTMTGSVTKRIVATCNVYNITVNVPTGVASVTVKGSTVEGDRTFTSTGIYQCHHFDNLSWDAVAATGYCWNANNNLTTVSGTHTVSQATSIGPGSASNNGHSAPGHKYYTVTVNIATNTAQCVVTGSTYTGMGNKTFTSSGTMTVYHFDTIRWTYTAVNGHHYSGSEAAGWNQTSTGSYSVIGSYTINDPGASINYYTVTVSYPANTASITAHGSSRTNGAKFTVDWGTTVSWTCTANTGYHYSGSEAGGWVDTASGSTTVYSTTTIPNTAAGGSNGASVNTYTVTIRYGANTASCSAAGAYRANNGSFTVGYGTYVTATFTASTGYHYSGSKPYWVDTHSKSATVYSATTITGDGASIDYYDVTVSYGGNTDSCYANGGYRNSGYSWVENYGTPVSATFTCDTGYHYTGSNPSWSGTTNSVSATVYGQTTLSPSITPSINTYTVTASWTSYTASCTLNGSSRGDGQSITVNYGDSCSVVFTTNTGYHYGSSNSNTTNSFTISNITSNVTARDGSSGGGGVAINANAYPVTVTYGTGVANVTANGANRTSGYSWNIYYPTTTASATFNAATGYHFGNSNSTTTHAHSGSVTNLVNGSITLHCADAVINTYTVTASFTAYTASCTLNGTSVSNGGSITVNHGASCSVTFTLITGYHYGTNQNTTSNSFTISNITSNVTAQDGSTGQGGTGATVNINTYTLTIAKDSGVSSTNPAVGTHTYNYNTSVTVTATPVSHYSITGGTGTFVMTQNRSTTVTSAVDSHTFSWTLDGGVASVVVNGVTRTASGSITVTHGTQVTVSGATAKAHYTISNSGAGTYTVTSNTTVNITTNPDNHTFSWTLGTGVASVTVAGTKRTASGSITVTHGTQVTVSGATAESHYVISNSGAGTYTMDQDRSVTISASRDTHKLTISADSGVQSFTPASGGTYTHGTSVTVTATAKSGYNITSTNPQTVTMDQDRTVTITSAQSKCTVTVTFDSGISRCTVNGTNVTSSGTTLSYDIGTKITWSCNFNTGYEANTGCSGSSVELTGTTYNINCTSKLKTYSVSIQKNTGVSSISATYNGSTWTSGSKTVEHGKTVSWNSTASSGYTMNTGSGWNAADGSQTVTSNSTISPTAKAITYSGTINIVINNLSDVDVKYEGDGTASGSGGSISFPIVGWCANGGSNISISFSAMTKDSSTKTFNLSATTSGLSGVSVISNAVGGSVTVNGNNYTLVGIMYLRASADNFSGTITLKAN